MDIRSVRPKSGRVLRPLCRLTDLYLKYHRQYVIFLVLKNTPMFKIRINSYKSKKFKRKKYVLMRHFKTSIVSDNEVTG